MAKKNKKNKRKTKEAFEDFQRASEPVIAADIWTRICDGLKEAFPNLEIGDIGYYHILAETAREIPEKEGSKCALEFSVSPGYISRLPLIDPQKAAEWETHYESAIALALAKFGGDAAAFEAGWKPVFEKCGTIRIELGTRRQFGMDSTALSARAIVRDDDGREITSFDMLENNLRNRENILYDFSDESIESFTQNLAVNAVSEDYQIRTPNREALENIFLGARLNAIFDSEWRATSTPMWREGLLMFLDPPSPHNIQGPLKEQVEAIVGTMEKPVFPQQKALFVIAAKPVDSTEDEWKVTVTGPLAYRQEHFANYRAWLEQGLEEPEKPLFSERLNLSEPWGEEDEPGLQRDLGKGRNLARKILDSLGAVHEFGEDE